MSISFRHWIAAAALASAAVCVSAAAQGPQPELPLAPPGVPVNKADTLTRLAFGSCNGQDQAQDIWAGIAGTGPQLFLAIGDNVYGDPGWDGGADLASYRAAYAKQSTHDEFHAFRAQVPMAVTWDDHDYGPNDAGADFAFRDFSEEIFETYWGVPESVSARDGVHDSFLIGPEGRRVQVILLDTRFFRSPLATIPQERQRGLGRYGPGSDPAATMLGEEQWRWLAQELAKPAELRIVVSSIQVLTDAHEFERWGNFPAERERLYAALAGRAESGVVLLSGDRHSAGIYRARPEAMGGEEIWEFTSSSLNRPAQGRNVDSREPDPLRDTAMIGGENFGLVDVDWAARRFIMRLLDDQGREIYHRAAPF